MPSIIAKVPANGFQPSIINQENQIPNNNAIYTCFVLRAKIIATIGGITERNPYSIKRNFNLFKGSNYNEDAKWLCFSRKNIGKNKKAAT